MAILLFIINFISKHFTSTARRHEMNARGKVLWVKRRCVDEYTPALHAV